MPRGGRTLVSPVVAIVACGVVLLVVRVLWLFSTR
jgi:hypothetical protein